MQRRESSIEKAVVNKAAAYGILSVKLGLEGWPDRIFWLPGGRPFLIEFKRPGETPDPLQLRRIDILRQLGYQTEVYDEATDAFSAIVRAVEASCLSDAGYGVSPHTQRSGVAVGPWTGEECDSPWYIEDFEGEAAIP